MWFYNKESFEQHASRSLHYALRIHSWYRYSTHVTFRGSQSAKRTWLNVEMCSMKHICTWPSSKHWMVWYQHATIGILSREVSHESWIIPLSEIQKNKSGLATCLTALCQSDVLHLVLALNIQWKELWMLSYSKVSWQYNAPNIFRMLLL